jgi:hypothetical protein
VVCDKKRKGRNVSCSIFTEVFGADGIINTQRPMLTDTRVIETGPDSDVRVLDKYFMQGQCRPSSFRVFIIDHLTGKS